ncbi:MAG: hypothetical protein LBT00_04615 [Spirochaetaceae bacterium]|jgi:hypothetical protein|nr:hypothetical protein [Spirochaetaceae bacterium]
MKKVISILTVAVVMGTAAWAQDGFSLSAGGGGYLAGDLTGGVEMSGIEMTNTYFGGGPFVFFDAKYAEVSVGLLFGGGEVELFGFAVDTTRTSLNISLLGKYPFALSDKLTLFPAVGIDYEVVLGAKFDGETYQNEDGDDAPGDFSALWIKAGAGLDVSLTEKLYFRGEALLGFRLANKFEKDLADEDGVDTKLGIGPTVKLGVGYKF